MMTDIPFSTHGTAIAWEQEHPDGTRSATLAGTRDPGVQFTYAFFIPAGFWDAPHSHCADAHVYVMQGTLRLAYGEDATEAVDYPAGSYLFVPAELIHTDGADVDTIILGNAVGPWSTDYLDD
jgi:quercetin dioxygenase-like cupin family protein